MMAGVYFRNHDEGTKDQVSKTNQLELTFNTHTLARGKKFEIVF